MTVGVSSAGLTIKTLEEIKAEIEADQIAAISPELDQSNDQPLGQMNAIVAKKAAELWELGQTGYNAFNPAAAEGFLLDALCLLSGTIRQQATKSQVVLACNLDVGTTLLAGVHQANVLNQAGNKWEVVADFTAPSTGVHNVAFQSIATGPVTANAGTITVITTAVAGWNSVTNSLAASPGRARESDPALRLRRQQELSAPGAGTVDAIRADVARVAGVLQCAVFENTTDLTNIDGLPPHSFEVVIWDGVGLDADNQVVAQTIWNDKPAGIYTHGAITVSVYDSGGTVRAVRFSRATQRSLELSANIQVLPGWNAGQVAEVQAALIAKVGTLKMGQDVIVEQLKAVILAANYAWDVTSFTIGNTGGTLFSSNVSVASREQPLLNGPVTLNITQLPAIP